MRSTEFRGFICDGCGKPVTVEQAEHRMIHLDGSISRNNDMAHCLLERYNYV